MASGGAQRLLLNVIEELSRSNHELVLLHNPGELYFLPEINQPNKGHIGALDRKKVFLS